MVKEGIANTSLNKNKHLIITIILFALAICQYLQIQNCSSGLILDQRNLIPGLKKLQNQILHFSIHRSTIGMYGKMLNFSLELLSSLESRPYLLSLSSNLSVC